MLLNLNSWVHMFLIFYVTRQKVCIKLFCYLLDHSGFLKEHSELVSFFHGTQLLLEKNDWQTKYGYSDWGYLEDIFSKMSKVSLSFQEKLPRAFVANGKIWAFKWNLQFWKTYTYHHGLGILLLLLSLVVILNKCDFWTSTQEDLHNFTEHYVPNIITSHRAKDSFKVQDRWMDLNVTIRKVINTFSDSILWMFKEHHTACQVLM